MREDHAEFANSRREQNPPDFASARVQIKSHSNLDATQALRALTARMRMDDASDSSKIDRVARTSA